MIQAWKSHAKAARRDIRALYLARNDPRIPWYAKLLALLIVAYAISPIDLIPDFIPVIGYLDDMVLVPAGVILLLMLLPAGLMDEYRIKAQDSEFKFPRNWAVGALIIALWLTALTLAFILWKRHFAR
jgi:uncharacterized membrane protein YkvA (DUF1232 family)